MEGNWLSFFSAALSGGVSVKLMDILYQELQSRSQRKRSAKAVVDKHLDPLLKAADEIVGKTRSLAERDFADLISAKREIPKDLTIPSQILGIAYLYAQFWGRVEILRADSLGVSIGADKRGAMLKNFLACLESQRIRLVDRTHQRAIGEFAIRRDKSGRYHSVGLLEFSSGLAKDAVVRNWLNSLLELLANIHQKRLRQKVLVYGVVMHAMIDTLDPDHHSTHERPGYVNKLSKESKNDVRFRVFGRYLKEVSNTKRYVGK